MADRVSFSDQEQSLEDIAFQHENLEISLFEFFASDSPRLQERFPTEKRDDARDLCLEELDFSSSMSVMSALEAAIRRDYLSRVYERRRDALSREFKTLHGEVENRAKLEKHLLPLWRENAGVSQALISEVTTAFKHRHWLAHGRYWTPKLGKKFDYISLYQIAEEFIEEMNRH